MPAKLLLKRVLAIGLSATIAGALLLALLAWVALNAEWRVPDPAQLNSPSIVLDRHGNVLTRFTAEQDRRMIGIEQVSEDARNAVVAAEDRRFYDHQGVDPWALIRAVVVNVTQGRIEQGASTLTQQYVRNGLEGISRERTVVRKIKEAVIALQLERELGQDREGKNQILERYLNTVYFGEGAYGIEAAALTFFGKPAAELTAAEGATLAQALPAPSTRNARVDPRGARERRDEVLDVMAAEGFLTAAEAAAAKAEPLEVLPRQRPPVTHPFFVEYVRRQLVHNLGQEAVLTGGLEVTTTIDGAVQTALHEAVAQELPPQEGVNADVQAAAVAIDPRTGDILGMYGGRNFDELQLNLAAQAPRQNGSAFKPIAFTAALEAGFDPERRYPAPGAIRIPPSQCKDYDGVSRTSGAAPGGTLTMREGLIRSINTVLLQIACDVGPPAIIDTAYRLGVRSPLRFPDAPPNPAVALGAPNGPGATVLDLTSAFATFANDGRYCPARSIVEVRGPAGETVELPEEVTIVPQPEYPTRSRNVAVDVLDARPDRLEQRDAGRCVQTVDRDVARTTTQALEQVVARSTGRRAQIGRPQAGKTGTTDEETDAWFVGYTPDLVLAVWVGHTSCANPELTECQLRNIEGFRRVQGGTIPAQIWKAAAERILADVPPSPFLEPGEIIGPDGRAPGPPTRVAPSPTAAPTPSPTPTTTPSPTPTPTPTGGTDGSTDGGGDTGTTVGGPGGPGGDDGGDGCLLLFCPDDGG